MKRKKKLKNRRLTAIVLVFALCLTMSGFKSFIAYGVTDPETVSTGDEIANTASVPGEIGNDGESLVVTNPDSAGDEDTDDGVEAYSEDTDDDDADTGDGGTDDTDTSDGGADDPDETGDDDADDADETGDDASDGEEGETKYWLDYGPYECDMLPDDTRDISFSLRYSAQDEDGNEYEDEAENFDLNVSVSDDPEDYDEYDYFNSKAVSKVITGTEMTVKALEKGGIMLEVTALVDDEKVATEKLWFNVTESYRTLSCDIENVELGETISLSDMKIMEYTEGEDSKDIDGYTLSFGDYDPYIWEVANGSDDAPLALKRIRPDRTNLQVIAENKNGDGLDKWFSFKDLGYWVHLEQDEDDVQNYLFSGDSMTINAVCERDSIPEDVKIKWEVFEYDEEQPTEAVTYTENQEMLTLTANEGYDGTWVQVRVTLLYGEGELEEELDSDQRDVEIRDVIKEYNIPDPGVMLLTDDWWIGNEIDYRLRDQKHPNDEYGMVPITNIDIIGRYTWDEDGNVEEVKNGVAYLEGDADEGWNLEAQSCGYVTLAITYQKADNESETETQQTDVYISGERYNVGWDYPEGTSQILVGEEMCIDFSMSYEWVWLDEDGNVQCDGKEIEDFDVVPTEYDDELINVKVEGNKLVITGEAYGGTLIRVSLQTDREERTSTDIWVDVSPNYTNLKPVSLANVEIGDTLDLGNIEGGWEVEYKETTEDGETITDQYTTEDGLRFRLTDYNKEIWSVDDEDADLPVLTRLSQDGTQITIVAEIQNEDGEWEEIERRDYWFDYLDYNIGWGEDQVDCVFKESELELTLNDENLKGKENAEIEWTVGYWNGEGEDEEFIDLKDGSLFTAAEDGRSITLNGTALFEKLYKLELGGVTVHAQVIVDGEPIDGADTWIYVEVLEPGLSWDDGDSLWLLPGQIWHYYDGQGTAWIRNADYPYGEESVALTITNVKIEDESVVKWDTEDDGTGTLTASTDINEKETKETKVTFTAKDETKGKVYDGIEMTIKVKSEIPYFFTDCKRENDNIDSGDYILPGASMTICPELRWNIYDADTNEQKYGVLMNDVEFSYSYDNEEEYPDLLTVTDDGQVKVKDLKALEKLGYSLEDLENGIWTYVTITASYEGKDGLENESFDKWFCVTSEYETEETEILYLEPGDTVSPDKVNAYIMRYTQDSPYGEVVSKISVKSFDTDDSALTVSGDGKTLTVSKDLVITDEPYRALMYIGIDENEFLDLFIQVDNHTHIWDEGTVTKEPTCTEEGIKTYTCTKATCGETKTEIIPLKGHALEHYVRVEPTATANGNIEYWYCDVCGKYFRDAEAKYEIPAAAIVLPAVKPATPVSTGSANGTANAGNTTNTSGTGTAASPGTGDQNMTLLWFVVMAGALGVLFTVGVKRRRSR